MPEEDRRTPPNEPARPDDAELVLRAKQGDDQAMRELLDRHYDGICAMAARMLRDPDRAQDAAQEIMTDTFKNIRNFRGGSKFSTWLFRIARNRLIKHYKLRDRTRPEETGHDLEYLALARSPEELHDSRVSYVALVAAIQHLPAEQSVVFNLRFLAGLNVAETASALGITEDAVMMRTSRGRQRLRELLRLKHA
jgi:RNA polymerase sigma-70 factor, ECF subfamily